LRRRDGGGHGHPLGDGQSASLDRRAGGLAAIALRAWYVSDEELALDWTLTGRISKDPRRTDGTAPPAGPAWRVALPTSRQVRTIGGLRPDRHRRGRQAPHQVPPTPHAVAARIETARARPPREAGDRMTATLITNARLIDPEAARSATARS
jgi:hypothetical protein